jgi:hydroxymethylpyrimidine/phosphomethylpyrimidine kinase
MCFNASDPSGAGGLAGDIATIAAMGAHALPIVTAIVMRDTADIFDQHEIDAEAVAEQARTILEDVTIAGWKVGFLGNADNVSAVAEILSDYTEIPLVSYLHNLSWLEEDQLQPYLDAFRELILPATEVLVGSHKTLQDFLLPDWDSERPPSARELAVAAGEHGTRYVLVTGVMLASKGTEQFIDNVLASPQGAIAGEKFERFDTIFCGRRRHAGSGAGRTAVRRRRAAGRRGRGAVVPGPEPGRGLPPRHGPHRARPLLLGHAPGRRRRRARRRARARTRRPQGQEHTRRRVH